MHIDDIYEALADILPEADIQTDNEGQVVIYTNKRLVGNLVEDFDEESEDNGSDS